MVRFPTGKRLCANITDEALDRLGGVVRRRFQCFSKPSYYVIAVKQLSRSLVFCFCTHSKNKQKMESNKKTCGGACLQQKLA